MANLDTLTSSHEPTGQVMQSGHGGAAVDALGLTISAGKQQILRGISASLPTSAVSALVGPNGSGKSTFLRLLAGAVEPDTGTVLLSGTDFRRLSRRNRARQLALVEQDAPAGIAQDVLDVVLLGRTPHRPRWASDSDADVDLAYKALERAGAGDLIGRDFATLSGGERQRVHIARALCQEPRLLLLDEPTNHLDIAAQLAVLTLAGELSKEGVTVLAALHDLNHALQFCDHVVVLNDGRVVAAGVPREILTEELVGEVYGVRATRIETAGRRILVYDSA